MKLKDILLDLFGSHEPDGPGPEPIPAAPAPAAGPKAPSPAPPKPAAAPAPAVSDPRGRDEAAVLAFVRRHGGEYRRVVFTRNRRIMASVGKDRGVLRLNAAFASASDEVLAAVAVLFSPSRGKRKEAAKETVRRFIDALPAPPPAERRVRRRTTSPADRPLVERLQAEFDATNQTHFGGTLPRVPIHLSRKMRRRNGHFASQPLEIVISHRLCTHGHPGEAEHTVRHEMIHLWQYMTGAPVDHGPAFRRMAKKLDVHPRATRPVRWKGR
ncbi:MAG TPA: SprT-like domain-containing protein [Longimicrobium sp.]|nr:SprT-like domain-containing protein [Longimicrobium sp.]